MEKEKFEKKEEDKKIEQEKKEQEKEKTRDKKTTSKATHGSKKKIIVVDDDDDFVRIKGPIEMENLSSSQLMEIAQGMQSRAHKKRMKEQQREAKTIRTIVDILSSLLPNTNTKSFVTPIDKLGQLVINAIDQLNTFEDAAYILVEKDYKKERTKQLMSNIDKGKLSLMVNKDLLKTRLETGGKILATVSKFSLFCVEIRKKRDDSQEDLEVLREGFKPVNDNNTFWQIYCRFTT